MKGRVFIYAAAVLLPQLVSAQRADDNAVTAAEDAFGATLGDESIGLYSSSRVRGFSPVAAGNVRLEGLYFDRQAWLPARLVEGSTIHVGIAAQGYPFPAPTGIVDYRLHKVDDTNVVSIAAGFDPYAAPSIEVDAKIPLVQDRFGIGAGLSYAHEEYYDGADAYYLRAALIPRWRITENFEVIPFWGVTQGRDEEVAPTIVTSGSFAPPQIERRRYFGQTWAQNESDSTTYGVLTKARIGESWAIAAGVFRSVQEDMASFADIYTGTQRNGLTTERLIADPEQRYASTSGEIRASRSFVAGPRLHTVHMSVRARELRSAYGGAVALNLGTRLLGERVPVEPPPGFAFRERTRDAVDQTTLGVGYELRWRGVGEASVGVQRADYEKRIKQPGLPEVGTEDDPWLVSATLAAHASPRLAFYAGYTRGLEESGIAPDSAANRNEALPAIRTQQMDGGARWALTKDLKLVAGLFEVKKPYFTTNESNIFTTLGDVRHRGLEMSLNGTPHPDWSLVAGAVLMEPRVTGEPVREGRIGRKPVGQTERLLRLNVEYRPPVLRGFSFDLAVANYGERVASSDGMAVLPDYTIIDVGTRYRTKIGGRAATLRFWVGNVTDEFFWDVFASNSFGLSDGRRYSATLYVDI
jgi:iron complex outermembrane recepter protein